jgi:hypothetical protein
MNTYDDIQRFLEKSKMKDIDYKEINENPLPTEVSASKNQWAVIRQVSQANSTTASTPLIQQGVSTDEFANSSLGENNLRDQISNVPATRQISTQAPQPSSNFSLLDALQESFSAPVAPESQAEPVVMPSQASKLPGQTDPLANRGTNLIDALNDAMPTPITEKTTARPPAQPLPDPRASRVSVAPRSATPERYKQMFKQKAPQSASQFLHRDTPLQPLLEMIALCR